VLIAVKHLVNGVSIAPTAPAGMTAIEYYHVEFDTHEVMLAEGAPVESFLEAASEREYFSNFVQYERLYGRDQARTTPFAPILGYRNRRQKLVGLARSALSNIADVRDPIQIVRDQLARRAEALPV
jgi:Hint domain